MPSLVTSKAIMKHKGNDMRAARQLQREDATLRSWFEQVSAAAAVFESRWTMRTLCRIDTSLATRLREQRDLFDEAMVTGTDADIERHGVAMCRGYVAVCSALERAEAPDDAYMLGADVATGLRVAVGVQKAAATRAAEIHDAIWVTPDEIAAIMASAPFTAIAETKRLFPGAELVEFRKTEDEAS